MGHVSQAAAAGLGWSKYIWWDGHKIRNRQILSGKLTLPSDAEHTGSSSHCGKGGEPENHNQTTRQGGAS